MNAIYKHPGEDKFTFLENVPEKPTDYGTEKDRGQFPLYERALAEAIEKRMVIGNPTDFAVSFDDKGNPLIFTGFKGTNKCYKSAKEGELYSWPGTWEKIKQFKVEGLKGIEWQNLNKNVYDEYPLSEKIREVVILSPPKEEPDVANYFGQEPVNSSMSYSDKPKPMKKQLRIISHPTEFEAFVNSPDVEVIQMDIKSVEQSISFQYGFVAVIYFKVAEPVVSQDQEEQSKLWRELIDIYDTIDRHHYGYGGIINKLSEKFTITRKPTD